MGTLALPAPPVRLALPSRPRRMVAGRCARCAAPFVTPVGNAEAIAALPERGPEACSRTCQDALRRARAQAAKPPVTRCAADDCTDLPTAGTRLCAGHLGRAARSCQGKQRRPDRHSAQWEADRLGGELHAYHCPICEFWHTGRATRTPRAQQAAEVLAATLPPAQRVLLAREWAPRAKPARRRRRRLTG